MWLHIPVIFSPLARKSHTVTGLTKYHEREKNLHGIRGEYMRRMRRGFCRLADGNRAFSIGSFVAFIPARRHKPASRRVATLHCFSLRESAATSNRHRVGDSHRRRGANGPLSVLFTDVHRNDSVNSQVNVVLREIANFKFLRNFKFDFVHINSLNLYLTCIICIMCMNCIFLFLFIFSY